MNEHGNELTHILIAYANQCGCGSSFSERIDALSEAREQILALFEPAA